MWFLHSPVSAETGAVGADRSALHHQPTSPANPNAVRLQQAFDHLAFLHRSQKILDDVLQLFLVQTEIGD